MNRTHNIATILDIFRTVLGCLANIDQDSPTPPNWEQLSQALESLPLSIEDYAVCLNRVQNALLYWEDKERGATVFELGLLQGKLLLLAAEWEVERSE